MKRRVWFYKATDVVLWSDGRSSNFSSMVFRFLFRYFRTFLQTLPKFSEVFSGQFTAMTACIGRRCLGGDKEPFTFPGVVPFLDRRRSYPSQKEILRLDEGSFDLDRRRLREKRKALRGGRRASPSERGGSRRGNL